MTKMEEILASRLKKKETQSKMEEMVKKSSQGELTSFSGIFHTVELSLKEKDKLEEILRAHQEPKKNIEDDLKKLAFITSEVKAITTQAIILHGERIKKVQEILMNYREGAFTAWLVATYGNRQTPYNFLQYYEFVEKMGASLKLQIDQMPKQAIYTLASRTGPIELKKKLVIDWKGETKEDLLRAIREMFPLSQKDQRAGSPGNSLILSLRKTLFAIKRKPPLKAHEKKEIVRLLDEIKKSLE